jgi:hypothetical protein
VQEREGFLGRRTGVDVLRAALDRAGGGHGSTVLVSGEARPDPRQRNSLARHFADSDHRTTLRPFGPPRLGGFAIPS